MVCPKCHTEINEGGSFCPYCGSRLRGHEPEGQGMWEAVFPCLLTLALIAGALWVVWNLGG